MYVLQGAKCGSVRFEPFVNGVINKETVSRQSTITDNPIEGGGSINDHVFRSPLSFQLSGTVTDGAAAIATLQQMWMKGDILTYTGRTKSTTWLSKTSSPPMTLPTGRALPSPQP